MYVGDHTGDVRGAHTADAYSVAVATGPCDAAELRAARADVTWAFITFYCALVFGRSLYLGEPLTIPLHRLESGALLLFTFFMISDPKTTPDSRAGRILFAVLVAFGAAFVQFKLFRTNGLLWSLALFSLAVPLLDYLLPGTRYRWQEAERFPQPLLIQINQQKKGPYEPAHV